jgi:hypothetical protein
MLGHEIEEVHKGWKRGEKRNIRGTPRLPTPQEHLGCIGDGGKNRHTLSVRINTACAPPNMAAVVIP